MSDVEDIPPKEFNVYDDIKGKLMDRGVPEMRLLSYTIMKLRNRSRSSLTK